MNWKRFTALPSSLVRQVASEILSPFSVKTLETRVRIPGELDVTMRRETGSIISFFGFDAQCTSTRRGGVELHRTGAFTPMDGHTTSARDPTDHVVARNGTTALGEANEQVVHSVDNNAVVVAPSDLPYGSLQKS